MLAQVHAITGIVQWMLFFFLFFLVDQIIYVYLFCNHGSISKDGDGYISK